MCQSSTILLTEISDFKAKMHQIRFRLGLRPRSRPLGSLQRSPPQTPLLDLRGLLLRGGRGREGKGRDEGKEIEREGEGREEREGDTPDFYLD